MEYRVGFRARQASKKLLQQRFQFSDPHGKTLHGHRFDAHFAKRGGHEIISLVAGDERHIGDGGKSRFEFFLGVDALGSVGQLFEIAGCARYREVCTKPRVPLRR
jgi:hypothetical protein